MTRTSPDLAPPLGSDALLALLKRETLTRRTQTRNLRLAAALLALVTLACATATWARHGEFPWETLIPLLCLFAGGLSMGAGSTHKAVARAAAAQGDKRALGGLLELLDAGDPDLAQTAKETATVWLLQMGEGDEGLLDDRQRATLFRQMQTAREGLFVSAAITALGRMGGADAIAPLEAIAGNGPLPVQPVALRPRLQNQALAALAATRIRLARAVIEQTDHRLAAVREVNQTGQTLYPAPTTETVTLPPAKTGGAQTARRMR